jgi:hypothetical protein
MKINLYEELQKLGVFPVKNSTANFILTESNKPAAVGLLISDYKQHKQNNGYFLQKKTNDLSMQNNLHMNDFNLEDFMCSHLVSLLEAEFEAAIEEEDQTITEISQWLR